MILSCVPDPDDAVVPDGDQPFAVRTEGDGSAASGIEGHDLRAGTSVKQVDSIFRACRCDPLAIPAEAIPKIAAELRSAVAI